MVTSATYHKERLFSGETRLAFLQEQIFRHCEDLSWNLQAWAVFPNHFHVIAAASDFSQLKRLLKRIHGSTGAYVNREDCAVSRTVWYRDWTTPLTFSKSILARLKYVHENAVHHGLVERSEDYPFCSAAWFKTRAERSFFETVMSFPIDRLNVYDEF
jgi:putative transposase